MADEELRRIERLARTGDAEAIERLRRHRERTGTLVPAVHYVPDDYHIYVKADGAFDLIKGQWHSPGVVSGPIRVMSPCGVCLWPRGEPTQRKKCRFTKESIEVTCKTCVRTLAAPKVKRVLRKHYAPGSFGGRSAEPVCRKSDPNKYKETFHHSMKDVNCPICVSIMKKGQRRSRA
jgi:ribosomal protein S27E